MNELKLFNFKENEVRTFEDDTGNLWWVAKDVFRALNIKYTGSQSLVSIKDDWKQGQEFPDPNGRMQET